MPLAQWPSDVPTAPLVQGYNDQWPMSWGEADTDSGNPVRWRQFTAPPPGVITVTWSFTRAQLDTFQFWFAVTLGYGRLPFTWTHPRLGWIKSEFVRDSVSDRPTTGSVKWLVTASLKIWVRL